MRMRNSLICCGTRMWKTLFKAEERSILKDCHVRYQKFASNSAALCVPEEGSHEIRFQLTFLCLFSNLGTQRLSKSPSTVCCLRGEFKSTKAKVYVLEIARHEEYSVNNRSEIQVHG